MNAHSSGERSPANTLTLRLRDNVWTATYGAESEDAARILDAFGTLELPLPYTEVADPRLVLRAIQGRFTRYTVVIDPAFCNCCCCTAAHDGRLCPTHDTPILPYAGKPDSCQGCGMVEPMGRHYADCTLLEEGDQVVPRGWTEVQA